MAAIPWGAIFLQWGAYLFVGFGIIGIIARFQAGFFGPWLRVRASMERLVLVKVKAQVRDYFRPGKLDEGFLVFTDRLKQTRRIALPKDKPCIYRAAGVNTVEIDDKTNAVLMPDLKGVTGFDAVMYEDLYVRAWNKPQIIDDKTKIIIFLLVILCIVLVVEVFFLYRLGMRVDLLARIAQTPIVSTAAAGGV